MSIHTHTQQPQTHNVPQTVTTGESGNYNSCNSGYQANSVSGPYSNKTYGQDDIGMTASNSTAVNNNTCGS